MMGLSDRERISMIRSAVLIQYTRMTDRQTDGIGVAYTALSISSRGKKFFFFPVPSYKMGNFGVMIHHDEGA